MCDSDLSSQPKKRSSTLVQDLENSNTPQTTHNRSGLLPLKRVFSRVLADVTNTVQQSPSDPLSQVFNHPESVHYSTKSSRGLIRKPLPVKLNERTRPSTKQNLPDLNTSGLTWQSLQGSSSINDTITSSKRSCGNIRPKNLFKSFSSSATTDLPTTTTLSRKGKQGCLYETNIEEIPELQNPLEEESYQIYDISSEEENTNDDDHSECDTPTLPQEEISDQSAYISTMATVFKTMFEEKPVKKGWAKKKYRENQLLRQNPQQRK
ncbi:hypothetical protein HID58_053794, partial [Brassica napus]